MKVCKGCGVENRGEAQFCKECGVPLASSKVNKIEKKRRDPRAEAQIKKFWGRVVFVCAMVVIVLFVISNQATHRKKLGVLAEYSAKYAMQDEVVLSAVNYKQFNLMSLIWGMSVPQARQVYAYLQDSNDPDFSSSMMINQPDFKIQFPHANFMSLGFHNGSLYAVKFELGATEEYLRQQVKTPDKDEKIYGRFLGLKKRMTKLYGKPAFEKNEIKNMDVIKGIKYIKKGVMKDKKTRSNTYIYWDLGDTKAELVLFGGDGKIHLTVRYLYMPVWKNVGK